MGEQRLGFIPKNAADEVTLCQAALRKLEVQRMASRIYAESGGTARILDAFKRACSESLRTWADTPGNLELFTKCQGERR